METNLSVGELQPPPSPSAGPRKPEEHGCQGEHALATSNDSTHEATANTLKDVLLPYMLKDLDRSAPLLRRVSARCLKLLEKDYVVHVLDNSKGSLCSHYPHDIFFLAAERNSEEEAPPPSATKRLQAMMHRAQFARCRRRFPVPVLRVRGKHICRSATLSTAEEISLRLGMATVYSHIYGDNAPDYEDAEEAEEDSGAPSNAAGVSLRTSSTSSEASASANDDGAESAANQSDTDSGTLADTPLPDADASGEEPAHDAAASHVGGSQAEAVATGMMNSHHAAALAPDAADASKQPEDGHDAILTADVEPEVDAAAEEEQEEQEEGEEEEEEEQEAGEEEEEGKLEDTEARDMQGAGEVEGVEVVEKEEVGETNTATATFSSAPGRGSVRRTRTALSSVSSTTIVTESSEGGDCVTLVDVEEQEQECATEPIAHDRAYPLVGQGQFDERMGHVRDMPAQAVVEPPSARDARGAKLISQHREADIQLLHAVGVRFIFDLMVENRKIKYHYYVSSSEKADTERRYDCFTILAAPYPGCEDFVDSDHNGYDPFKTRIDWSNPAHDAELALPHRPPSLDIDFSRYREWTLGEITANYMKYLIPIVTDDTDRGLLLHCVSGWDRTPLFTSLLRLTLWADGLCHASLNAEDMLYLTVAYDWVLFGHQLPTRLARRETILFFCFDFLKHLTGQEFASVEATVDAAERERRLLLVRELFLTSYGDARDSYKEATQGWLSTGRQLISWIGEGIKGIMN